MAHLIPNFKRSNGPVHLQLKKLREQELAKQQARPPLSAVDFQGVINPQDQCMLFKFPTEIRLHIFSYVVTEQNGKTAIPKTSYYYRPDYTHYRYIDTALLRTCRRVWLETNTLPRQEVLRRFWQGVREREPSRFDYSTRKETFEILDLEPSKSGRIRPCETAQIFIQLWALESGDRLLRTVEKAAKFCAVRHLIITIRYTDWWWWEDNALLRTDSSWTSTPQFPASIQKITLELETRQGKKAELDTIISHQFQNCSLSTIDERELTVRDPKTMIRSFSYLGTNRPGDAGRRHHDPAMNPPPAGERAAVGGAKDGEMWYYVVKIDYVV